MLSRINLFGIVSDHLRTLRRYDSTSDEISCEDFCLFILLPLIVSLVLVEFELKLDSHVTDLITSISILGGFLFNLLAIIYGLMEKIKDSLFDASGTTYDDIKERVRQRFIKEIHVNISFNIVLSLFILVLLVVYSYLAPVVKPELDSSIQSVSASLKSLAVWKFGLSQLISRLIYFLLGMFSLTMLLIVNRVYIILNKGLH